MMTNLNLARLLMVLCEMIISTGETMARPDSARKPANDNGLKVPTTHARRVFGDLVSRAEYAGKRTAVTKRGKVVAGIVSADDLAFLDANRPAAA